MSLNCLPHLAALVLVLTSTETLVVRASARVPDPVSAPTAPPSFPDAAHVPNGCHLSSIRFLNRFLAEFPAEHGQTLVVTMRNANGSTRDHTIALISWQGEAWCRDEYYGVFPLGCAAETNPNPERLRARAERKLEQHAQLMVRTGHATAHSEPPAHLSAEENLRDVNTAAKLIPYATTIFWVRCGNRELPMAFFRPAGKRIAVYDPAHGTSTADCACTDDAKVVLVVASRLGYRAESVRAGISLPQSTLLASADPATSHGR